MTKPLAEHRKEAYLSTRELAAKASVAPRTIWRIEKHDFSGLRLSTMRKISEALGVHPSQIREFVQAGQAQAGEGGWTDEG